MCRWGVAVSIALGAAISVAQTPALHEGAATRPADKPDRGAQIKKWFADLASPDAVVRNNALVELLGLSSSDLPTLKKIAEASRPLAPSQAVVLRQIVTQVYLSGKTYDSDPASGFIGIRLDLTVVSVHEAPNGESVPVRGIVVAERMPGFAGSRTLRDGDVILGVVDRPSVAVQDAQSFSLVIQTMGAGATVHLQVLRQGAVIVVPVRLDPRPVAADPRLFGPMDDLLEERRSSAEHYWQTHFAPIVKEGVS